MTKVFIGGSRRIGRLDAVCHAVANEHDARRATSAMDSSGACSSTVHASARQLGPISTRLR